MVEHTTSLWVGLVGWVGVGVAESACRGWSHESRLSICHWEMGNGSRRDDSRRLRLAEPRLTASRPRNRNASRRRRRRSATSSLQERKHTRQKTCELTPEPTPPHGSVLGVATRTPSTGAHVSPQRARQARPAGPRSQMPRPGKRQAAEPAPLRHRRSIASVMAPPR